MSLNEWSLLYFGVTALYFIVLYISLFTRLSVTKIFLSILAFMAQVGVTLAYGLSTNQIGFSLLFLFQLIIVTLMFIQYGRAQNANKQP